MQLRAQSPVHRSFRPDTRALLDALDHLEVGLGLFSEEGVVLYRNASLAALLGAEGGRPLRREMQALVEDLARRVRGRELRIHIERLDVREVRLGGVRLLLRASHIGMDLCGTGATILITVEERLSPRLPSEGELRARWGLTPAQARVARLLARRKTNAEIARALQVSEHTARNHTKAVMQRLGVSRRTEVARRLEEN
jgi:DNA-binding CsgD family transcriptional regulator